MYEREWEVFCYCIEALREIGECASVVSGVEAYVVQVPVYDLDKNSETSILYVRGRDERELVW